MAEPTTGLISTVRIIDRFTDVSGTLVAWLNVPLVLAVSYEVFSRYLFNAPTMWSFDVAYMLYGTIFMLGAAYALLKGAHIRTDFFFERWSIRTKGLIDSISYLVFFFPSIFVFLIVSWNEGWYAFQIGETSEQTPWRPILWPFKMVVPLACLLLLIQGVSEVIKSISAARTGIELDHKVKIVAQGGNLRMTGLAFLRLVMLIVMLGAIFIGVPISFTLLFLALTFGYFGLGHVVFDLAYLQTIGMMKEELLAAVPLFIFMGFLTEQAGLMERLFNAFRMLLAPIRGALFAVVILTATVFAMATGIVGAAVTVLGIMAGPIMIKTGYDAKLSAGCITAGGTLGILIPPSVMLIVMGPVIGVSVAELYSAAFGPGFLLAGIYLAYLIIRSNLNPKLGPPVPKEDRVSSPLQLVTELLVGVVPLLLLIAAVLGSMLAGLATPTEASAVGALGAALLMIGYGRFSWAVFKQAVLSTTATSSMVLLLAVTSNIFGAVFARLGTANWITETMLALPFSPVVMLLLVLGLIFLLGWPFEWPAVF